MTPTTKKTRRRKLDATTQRWFDGYMLLYSIHAEVQRTGDTNIPSNLRQAMYDLFGPFIDRQPMDKSTAWAPHSLLVGYEARINKDGYQEIREISMVTAQGWQAALVKADT